jgi:hypothetical protein
MLHHIILNFVLDAVRDLLIAFLRQCHFQDIRWEVKNWDHTAGPNMKEG